MGIPILFAGAWLGGYLFPWWWPALLAYGIGAWRPRSATAAFLTGFVSVAAAWAMPAAWQDWRNHHLLAARVAGVFHLPIAGPLAVTALVGGLIGGLGCWAGYTLRAWLWPRKAEADPDLDPDDARKAAADAAGSASASAGLHPAGTAAARAADATVSVPRDAAESALDDAGLPIEPESDPEIDPEREPDAGPEGEGNGEGPEPPSRP